MSKPEWGIKRVCPSCSIKYYDFNKNPIVCPKCEFEFDPDLLLKSRKGRSIATKTENDEVSNFYFNPVIVHLAGIRRRDRINFIKKNKNLFIK